QFFFYGMFFSPSNKREKAMRFSKTGFVPIIAFMMFTGTVNVINIIEHYLEQRAHHIQNR
ncbi:MAG TPA: hypothetical protein VER14_03455, partial [Phototrophicaceae bacterium]|nr:hypothetical protein [Phototrophicaceae bacterium]